MLQSWWFRSFRDLRLVGFVHSDFLDFPPRMGILMHIVNGRNPAPAWAYLTIHYDLYVRTPFSMLCVLTPCAPVQDFSHSTSLFWGQFFLPLLSGEHEGLDFKCFWSSTVGLCQMGWLKTPTSLLMFEFCEIIRITKKDTAPQHHIISKNLIFGKGLEKIISLENF